ncbi:ornithine cyclodeaminase family protein [Oerskovia flava]|uniref:ornithine cyclodeaminase family protein n=1 Tax=Oerskovia flava TaxID=2986422 RepID=UPI00223FE29A|nr:ornithine cyclodeaminase family protein [Oerskovia sp. JB1-3-2]
MPLVLTRSELAGLVGPADVVAAVEHAFADVARGTADQPPLSSARLPGADAQFLPLTAVDSRTGLAGSKLLADIPGNRARGLPAQRSVLVLVSALTGECEAVLDGGLPTRLRTAAASAVATRALARPTSSVLGLVGAGGLAVEHVNALAGVLELEQVLVWSRTPATTARFVGDLAAGHPSLKVTVLDSPAAVVGGSDVVCTLTPSREPVVRGEWFHPGLHVNAVGAPPRPDHREIDGAGMAAARVVVDSRSTALHESGDVLLAIDEGAIGPDHVQVELGDVLTGRAAGRTGPDEVTLFNSVGLGILDVAIGRLLLDAARALGRGTTVDLAS